MKDSPKDECDIWQDFCDAAKRQNNPRYKCIGNSVFYYETEQHSWDKARQLCSQKFYGSHFADLMELTDDRKEAVVAMMSNQTLESGTPTGKQF